MKKKYELRELHRESPEGKREYIGYFDNSQDKKQMIDRDKRIRKTLGL